jgi:hypothetical protein
MISNRSSCGKNTSISRDIVDRVGVDVCRVLSEEQEQWKLFEGTQSLLLLYIG